jgi:hypothetical protein
MIINDTYKFVFVHIPKCAGTYVRNFLQPYDETGGFFTAKVSNFPSLGKLNFVHMPLFVLREHFPAEYQKIRSYRSFALVRDPVQRFPSSMAEFLKFKGRPIKHVETSELIAEVRAVVKILSEHDAKEALLPHQFIHFQRQTDYVYDTGDRLVDNVYTVENVDDLLVDAGRILGRRLQPQQDAGWKNPNQSVVYRYPWVRRLVEFARPAATRCLKPILPESAQTWVRRRIYVPRQERFAEVFQSDEIKRFIEDYYKADLELYQAFSTK